MGTLIWLVGLYWCLSPILAGGDGVSPEANINPDSPLRQTREFALARTVVASRVEIIRYAVWHEDGFGNSHQSQSGPFHIHNLSLKSATEYHITSLDDETTTPYCKLYGSMVKEATVTARLASGAPLGSDELRKRLSRQTPVLLMYS